VLGEICAGQFGLKGPELAKVFPHYQVDSKKFPGVYKA